MLGEKILVCKINFARLKFCNSFKIFFHLQNIFIFTDNYFEGLYRKAYNDVIMILKEHNNNIIIKIKNDILKNNNDIIFRHTDYENT